MALSYSLAAPTWDSAEIAAMQRVIDSGLYTMGNEVRIFEESFAKYVGSQHAIMTNSGSSANLVMTGALMYKKNAALKPQDEILVPAVSWSTTFFPLHQYGLKMKFVDIDPNTLNYNLEMLESSITPKTRGIMVVNLLGNSNDFEFIQNLAAKHNLYILEDNCESLGATFNKKQCGTFGTLGTYSSFFSHHICTMEGGIVVTDDEELAQICRSLRAHGWTRDLPQNNHICDKSDDPFTESFRFVLPGYCLRPTELQGATGQEQLKKLPSFISERRKNAELFVNIMKNRTDIRIQKEIGESSWFGFSMIVTENASYTRADLVKQLRANNIDCRPIVAGNFTRNPVMKHLNAEIPSQLPAAEDIHMNGLFVGNHHFPLTNELKLLESVLDQLNKS